MPLFSSSELTGCGYPGLLARKNRSDMCPRWESSPRFPACKASTLSTRPGSPLAYEPSGAAKNIYTNGRGHMTNMATMPVERKRLSTFSSMESIDQWP